MQQRDTRLIEHLECNSIRLLFEPYAKATGFCWHSTYLKVLSHLIDRDVTSSKQVRRYEYERLMDYACPGWREGDWTHRPEFRAFARTLAAGYAVVSQQEYAARVNQPKAKKKSKYNRKPKKQGRGERVR